MVRMKDIATRLRLSQTTVSHVLTGKHEHYRISADTVDRVKRAAREMGYRSNALARAFRERRAYSVALAVEDLTNPFWTGVAIGAEREAEAQGYTLAVCNTARVEERERRVVGMLRECRVDGLIVSPITVADRSLLDLHREGRPFVQIDRAVEGVDYPCVRTDHLKGSLLAVDHLAKRKHRAIAYVGGPAEIQTYAYRLDGFRKALARRGLRPAAIRIIPPTAADAESAAEDLLTGPRRPTAIYGANLFITLGILRAIRRTALRVPDDLEIVGFDDIATADLFACPVSTVAQDVEAIGREAFRLLLRLMNGRPAAREVLIPPRLIAR
jgi:LacI family transcriptional regulator